MDRLRGLLRQLRAVLRRSAVDRELDEEVRAHLDMQTARNIADGMSPEHARRMALAVFGGRDAALEAHRDARGGRWIEDAVADARYALRTLRHNPALTAAAVLTIALGVGANTAIFSTLYAVVLRPLPLHEPNRLVMLFETNAERGWTQAQVAPANFLDWREQVPAFEDIAAYVDFEPTTVLAHDGEAQMLRYRSVTGTFFDVLGVSPVAGRSFTDDETWATGDRIAMISEQLWRTRFGGDPSILEQTIDLGGYPVRVVGVVPSSFIFPGFAADVFRPTAFARPQQAQVSFRRAHWLRAVARLRPGVTAAQADAALQVVVSRLERDYPVTNTGMGAGFTPLQRYLVGPVRQPLLALQVAVALLLLIACANVGNLLLVRAADRERESVVRLALGAGRGRLVRQALTESLVLSTIGGVAGVALGWIGMRVLAAMQPDGMLPVSDIGMRPGVLWFALAVILASGLLFSVGPALWTRRRAPADVLKEGGRGASRSRLRRWSTALAVAEVAIAVVLLAGAGLLVRSWWRVQDIDPGLDPDHVLIVDVNLPSGRFDTFARRQAFYDAALDRLRALPGVEDVSTVSSLPMTIPSWSSDFAVRGRGREDFGVGTIHREVSPRYHELLRVPLLAGRTFTEQDDENAPLVVLINESLARRYFPNEDPVGQVVAFDRYPDSTSYWRTIVGVVGNERQAGLETESSPEFFAPVKQDENGTRTILVRGSGDPLSLYPSVRRAIGEVSVTAAVNPPRTMADVHDAALARRRFVMTLVLTFAAAGLVLALVGVYGVMAQLARGRRREISIRVALGAPLPGIRAMVMGRAAGLALAGVLIGTAVALAARRAMTSMLYDIEATDPLTLVAVGLLLTTAAVAASWPPARRAAQVEPMESLRGE